MSKRGLADIFQSFKALVGIFRWSWATRSCGLKGPHRGALHALVSAEPMCLRNFGNAPIQEINHSIGSKRLGLGQPLVDAQRLAYVIKLRVGTGLALTFGEQVISERLTVVAHQFVDHDRAGLARGSSHPCRQSGTLLVRPR